MDIKVTDAGDAGDSSYPWTTVTAKMEMLYTCDAARNGRGRHLILVGRAYFPANSVGFTNICIYSAGKYSDVPFVVFL